MRVKSRGTNASKKTFDVNHNWPLPHLRVAACLADKAARTFLFFPLTCTLHVGHWHCILPIGMPLFGVSIFVFLGPRPIRSSESVCSLKKNVPFETLRWISSPQVELLASSSWSPRTLLILLQNAVHRYHPLIPSYLLPADSEMSWLIQMR
jgi:hypothetical protein